MENTFLVRNLKISFRLLFVLMLGLSISLASCSKDDDDDDDDDDNPTETTIPSDNQAGTPPAIDNNTLESTIPNPSFSVSPSNANRIVMQMTGIKDPSTGQYITMAGTGDPNQTCWLQVDGTNKGILVTKGSARQEALLADIVFTVDNSGSMGEEADSIALQITSWVQYLQSQGLDLNVGVVGYDSYVTGALNLGGVNQLYAYLNTRTDYYGYPVTGTARTVGFYGADSAELYNNSYPFGYAGGENGVLAIKFADQYFDWRLGANRIYVNFTDEPNQPGGEQSPQWSVLDMEANWHATQGTIHTVFSEDTTYYSGYWSDYYDEKPWRLSEITGGTYVFVDSYASDLNLNQLPVTGALAETFIIEYMNNEGAGPHTVQIFIENTNGNDGTRTYENISYQMGGN